MRPEIVLKRPMALGGNVNQTHFSSSKQPKHPSGIKGTCLFLHRRNV